MKPRPLQSGHVDENVSTRPSETRLRVISTRPSSEIGNTWVRVLSRASASRNASSTALAVALGLHVDEVDDDDPADVAQTQLAGHDLGRFEVVAVDRLLEVRHADVLAGVDVDDRQRLGALDDQRPARRQPHLAVERLVQLLVHVELLEDRKVLAPPRRSTRRARTARVRSRRCTRCTSSYSFRSSMTTPRYSLVNSSRISRIASGGSL